MAGQHADVVSDAEQERSEDCGAHLNEDVVSDAEQKRCEGCGAHAERRAEVMVHQWQHDSGSVGRSLDETRGSSHRVVSCLL